MRLQCMILLAAVALEGVAARRSRKREKEPFSPPLATMVEHDSLLLRWQPPPEWVSSIEPENYQVLRSDVGGPFVPYTVTNETSVRVDGLAPDSVYRFQVVGLTADGTRIKYDDSADVTTQLATPSSPSKCNITYLSVFWVRIAFDPPVKDGGIGIAGYKIYASKNPEYKYVNHTDRLLNSSWHLDSTFKRANGSWQLDHNWEYEEFVVASFLDTREVYIGTGWLLPGTNYSFRVSATNGLGGDMLESEMSDWTRQVLTYEPASAPLQLRASNITAGPLGALPWEYNYYNATLSWRMPSFDGRLNITEYRVQIMKVLNGSSISVFAQVFPSSKTYFTTGVLVPGSTYLLKAAAINKKMVYWTENTTTMINDTAIKVSTPQNYSEGGFQSKWAVHQFSTPPLVPKPPPKKPRPSPSPSPSGSPSPAPLLDSTAKFVNFNANGDAVAYNEAERQRAVQHLAMIAKEKSKSWTRAQTTTYKNTAVHTLNPKIQLTEAN